LTQPPLIPPFAKGGNNWGIILNKLRSTLIESFGIIFLSELKMKKFLEILIMFGDKW
jgi:hypothetical protein